MISDLDSRGALAFDVPKIKAPSRDKGNIKG